MRKKHVIWIVLGLVALLLTSILNRHPDITERLYGSGIYPFIRWILTHSVSYLPLPGVTILFCIGLWYFWRTAIRPFREGKSTIRSFVAGFVGTLGAIVFLFQFMWGLNYGRPTWDQRIGIEVKGMTVEQLSEEYRRTTKELLEALDEIPSFDALQNWSQRKHQESIEPALRQVLKEHAFPLSASPRVRIIHPKGLLMRWNTAGIYVPFSGESHVDAGMLPVQLPFTIAHEMAHGFGVTDEGDCNFLAYLTCLQAQDVHVRCAGLLSYWRYVASAFRRVYPDVYNAEFEQLPELLKQTLRDIHTNDAKYPDLMPKLRNKVYDSYLKSQGVPDGLQSYSRVVQLVWAYERKQAALE